jgi:tetratricopeptide (TPR) repeat protein
MSDNKSNEKLNSTQDKKDKQNKLDKQEARQKKKEAKRAERLADKERIRAEKQADREARFKIEDPIGFMRIINIASVILLIIALFLGIRYIINGAFLLNYSHGNYSPRSQEFLQKVNIPEGYLPYYNAGNAYYMLEDYDSAIDCYKSALESKPTEKKECDIRVNLALAMLHKVDLDNIKTEKQKANAIRTLQSARNVLCEKGCADPYGTEGHDPEAEQLKQDIDKMLEELGAEPEPDQNQDDQQQGGKGKQDEQKQKSKREQQLEKDLEKQKEKSMEERRDADNQKSMTGSGESGDNEGIGGSDNEPNEKNW